MERKRVSTGTEWEPKVGYSRALRVNGRILVSGTTATDENGDPVEPGNPEIQTRHALETVVDADDWETIGEVHGEFFGDVRPVSTMVEVSSLIGPEYVVEVEAEAVVSE
jgi:enamine deaminase RidA (YjgF/YER057c/UK114 family)